MAVSGISRDMSARVKHRIDQDPLYLLEEHRQVLLERLEGTADQ